MENKKIIKKLLKSDFIYRQVRKENKKIKKQIHNKLYSIGAPLNDNNLKFNNEQLRFLADLENLINRLR
jgi:hypothetical protein